MLYWLILAVPVSYFFYGLATRSPYVRRVAGGPDTLTDDGYLVPQEVVDPDEPELADRAVRAFQQDSLRRPKHVGQSDASFHEPHWGHTTGLLRGRLVIDQVDALPERFRVALFAKNHTYDVVARANYTHDPKLKLSANRLSVKIDYPEPVPNAYTEDGDTREVDLLFAVGAVATNGQGRAFFFRDAREMDLALTLDPPTAATLRTLSNWRNVRQFTTVLGRLKRLMAPLHHAPDNGIGWAGRPYFSAGPYALGEGAMKFGLFPRQSQPIPPVDLTRGDPAAAHLEAFDAWRAEGQPAEFDLRVQLARPEALPAPGPEDPPRSVMAAEYCDLHWDEASAPYVTVGTLTLDPADAPDPDTAWGLQFNAWNTLPEMRPLGQLFRIRKHVHAGHSDVRVSHLFGETPGAMTGKCPFH